MKHVTPNRIYELWEKGILTELDKKLGITRVLKTKEQVQANTNAENVASAVVVGELFNNLEQQPGWIYDAAGKITGYKSPGGADTVFPFSRNYISIDEYKSSMQPTHYNIGFRPKLVLCGVDSGAQFSWYNSETNKHYYGANSKAPYNLGAYSLGDVYKFDSIDDTGFTFNVGTSSYNNQNLIIIALG